MERCMKLPAAAEKAGISTKTLKRWLREAGYNMPPRRSKGSYSVLVPESLLERVVQARTPRLARA